MRLDLLGLLYMVVLMGNPHSEERESAETQVHQARLRITDPALRKEVLLEIPFEEEIAPRVDLLRELLAFPPVEAIRLLEPQVMTLGVDTHGLLLTGQSMELLLARSRQVPDGHPAFLHTLGRASKSIPDVVLRTRIGGLVLQDSLRLEVGHRLNILAALDGPEAGFRERWRAEWAAALAGTLQALGQATGSASAWHLIHALVPASKKRQSCDAVLQAQLAALPLLDPHDQVRALHTICHEYLVDRFDKEDGHLLQFIEAARQLPCYLRPRPGKLLHLLSKEAAAAVKARLGALDEETQAQRQAGLHDRGATAAPAPKPVG
ncbi:hypothetical protein GT347_15820 [Xylophilus rhododendri]|uniref:Uncharacterized protein n=1 Tax=Xylophilus rhododendri TaxID=2697032 RepID=A0A857J5P3_9BURK|nr:hypothetical protein [Xylophilus rhododendri]QHI99314.1 hypothetical protein GT347_15820 [Xylophilus rhododendri]